jgi:hypothetical protein
MDLTSITVDSGNASYKDIDGVLFSKDGKTLIQYPRGRTGAYTVPDGTERIGDSAFYYCTGLTSVVIGDGVVSIGDSAFYYCIGLTGVTISGGVTSIGDSAFRHCSKLTSVVIGSGVTDIGDYAFYACNKLTTVYYCGTEAEWNAVTIGASNAPLLNATMVYGYTGV